MKIGNLEYGKVLLTILSETGEIPFEQLEEKSEVKKEELKELLHCLEKEKGYLSWKKHISIGYIGDSESVMPSVSNSEIKLSTKGMEVVLGKRDYFNETAQMSQTVYNQTKVENSSEFQIAQNIGANSPITQVQDNSKINILKQLIENDKELDEPKKKKLLGILEKFNTLKQSGENALELIKQVSSIAIKYFPHFFSLLN